MLKKYAFGKAVPCPFDQAMKRVTDALQSEGVGVIGDIDVAGAMKHRLNVDMPPYHILSVSDAQLAQRALLIDPVVGVLLPCNVAVRQDTTGHVHIEFADPEAVLSLAERPEIITLAKDLRQRFDRAMQLI